MKFDKHYDVIVIGAGHAGIEASLASARLGCKTLILTMNLDRIGWMSCNPAIGGPGKSHIVSEIDALGGQMGVAADATYLQMKVLNSSKGPAVQALRAQSDKVQYHIYMKKVLEEQQNLDIKQDTVEAILVDKSNQITGLRTVLNIEYSTDCVVVTTGTFLKGLIHIGLIHHPAGRLGEPPSEYLSDSLRQIGLEVGRLKTGTTPRIDGQTLDYTVMKPQPGDIVPGQFSFFTKAARREQISCYLTNTNKSTHDIILGGLDRSPLYTGLIKGIGPRYCPSIEDKIVRFKDKESHQLFVEPEGADTHEIYLQGFNTSLPVDVQLAAMRTIKGLSRVRMTRPGYAIEYDFVFPRQLNYSLETRKISGLFLAGQINGTSGYEEAGGQGLIAGINAARKVKKLQPIILGREQSYIGILIDDLINKEIVEPYRMMTARAEFRMILRQDNADRRLSEIGYELGLVPASDHRKFLNKQKQIAEQLESLKNMWFLPKPEVNNRLIAITSAIKKKTSYADFLKRVEVSWDHLASMSCNVVNKEFEFKSNVEIEIKYSGYIDQVQREAARISDSAQKKLPEDIDYALINGLRKEAAEKLNKIRPVNTGQAARIAGVNPVDIQIILVYLQGKKNRSKKS